MKLYFVSTSLLLCAFNWCPCINGFNSIPNCIVHPPLSIDLVEYSKDKVETILAPKLCNKNCIIWWICQVNIPNGQTWELY